MSQESNEKVIEKLTQIDRRLLELELTTKHGHEGTQKRLDITNGKVLRHDEELKALKQIHSDEMKEEINYFKKWKHHIVWFVLLLIWTLLQATDLVRIDNPF